MNKVKCHAEIKHVTFLQGGDFHARSSISLALQSLWKMSECLYDIRLQNRHLKQRTIASQLIQRRQTCVQTPENTPAPHA